MKNITYSSIVVFISLLSINCLSGGDQEKNLAGLLWNVAQLVGLGGESKDIPENPKVNVFFIKDKSGRIQKVEFDGLSFGFSLHEGGLSVKSLLHNCFNSGAENNHKFLAKLPGHYVGDKNNTADENSYVFISSNDIDALLSVEEDVLNGKSGKNEYKNIERYQITVRKTEKDNLCPSGGEYFDVSKKKIGRYLLEKTADNIPVMALRCY